VRLTDPVHVNIYLTVTHNTPSKLFIIEVGVGIDRISKVLDLDHGIDLSNDPDSCSPWLQKRNEFKTGRILPF
jgi:hypothetical protein